MNLDSREMLRRLGRGETIAAVRAAAGLDAAGFDAWWQAECRARTAVTSGPVRAAGLMGRATIVRDARGVPHVGAENEDDLAFAYGYAVAQDRLFQLDYLRRKARGTLAELLGREAVESDRLARTLDLDGIARREASTLPGDVRRWAESYAAGVRAHRVLRQKSGTLPIEYALLDCEPDDWDVVDMLAIAGEFRWYLTGRFPVIAIPEVVRRALGDGPLYRDFLLGERDEESILQPGEYPTSNRASPAGGVGSGDDAGGSNNWAVAGLRTASGRPLVASDPHIPYAAVSIWHEVHLRGGGVNVAGVALAGMPAVMIGRTEGVAWGITNNICSQRDLYAEEPNPADADEHRFDGRWERVRVREETIRVRGGDAVTLRVRSTRNGPIVDDLLPSAARGSAPTSLRWLGFEPCGWTAALVNMNRAQSVAELRAAAEPWICPTFNLVFADVAGAFGFQSVGRIPLRAVPERAFRPGWDPQHQWLGVVPYAEMPSLLNPARGFVATANNRVAPDDFRHPQSGCWATGYRHRRIREAFAERERWTRDDCRSLQLDVKSGRAALGVPPLVAALANDADPRVRDAIAVLRAWDLRVAAGSRGAALFNVFFAHWTAAVVRERLPEPQASFATATAGGVALRLIAGDPNGWFRRSDRLVALRSALVAALDDLAHRLGPDATQWTWGGVHTLLQRHVLSQRGDLGKLLDLSGLPVEGDGTTLCAGTFDVEFRSTLGAGYRMVAELDDPHAGLWSIEVAGVSGEVGSRHYADQLKPWSAGELRYLPLRGDVAGTHQTLSPEAP